MRLVLILIFWAFTIWFSFILGASYWDTHHACSYDPVIGNGSFFSSSSWPSLFGRGGNQ